MSALASATQVLSASRNTLSASTASSSPRCSLRSFRCTTTQPPWVSAWASTAAGSQCAGAPECAQPQARSASARTPSRACIAAAPERALHPWLLRLEAGGEPLQRLGRPGQHEHRAHGILLGQPLVAHPLEVVAAALEEELVRPRRHAKA